MNIRPAIQDDISQIQSLLNHYASMGELLPRSYQDILENIDHFQVVENHQQIVGCGSLEHFTDELAEIRSLMVMDSAKDLGLGRKIVTCLIEIARERKVGRLMALTYVPEFFHKLGFITVDKSLFPEKIWGICVNCYKFKFCDETAVLLTLDYSE